MSEPGQLVHDVPFPFVLRIMFCAIGIFIAIIAPYELWRGVWPLNGLSPFFAMFIIAAWGGALAALGAGLGTSQRHYVFRRGALQVTETWVRWSRVKNYSVTDIVSLQSKEMESSEGPNMYYVEIVVRSGENYKSRMFDTRLTADRHADQFRQALGI